MIQLPVTYKTSSGNILVFNVTGVLMDRNDVPYVGPDDAKSLCGSCKGYNGGCPPFAPPFDKLKPSHEYMYVVCVTIDMSWSTLYAGGKLRDNITTRGDKSRLNMYRIVYTDRLSERYVGRILHALEARVDGYGLSVGNCASCPGKCTVVKTGKCSKPVRRKYSMEATGIECSSLHEMIFGERLPWWYRTVQLPVYMARYSGVLIEHGWSESCLDGELEKACRADKSYDERLAIETANELMPSFPIIELTAPEGCYDEGMKYLAYEVFDE